MKFRRNTPLVASAIVGFLLVSTLVQSQENGAAVISQLEAQIAQEKAAIEQLKHNLETAEKKGDYYFLKAVGSGSAPLAAYLANRVNKQINSPHNTAHKSWQSAHSTAYGSARLELDRETTTIRNKLTQMVKDVLKAESSNYFLFFKETPFDGKGADQIASRLLESAVGPDNSRHANLLGHVEKAISERYRLDAIEMTLEHMNVPKKEIDAVLRNAAKGISSPRIAPSLEHGIAEEAAWFAKTEIQKLTAELKVQAPAYEEILKKHGVLDSGWKTFVSKFEKRQLSKRRFVTILLVAAGIGATYEAIEAWGAYKNELKITEAERNRLSTEIEVAEKQLEQTEAYLEQYKSNPSDSTLKGTNQ